MPSPNLIKRCLQQDKVSIGCWLTLASPAVAELLAHCGFDWMVVDAEHGPSDTGEIAAQLRAIDAARAHGAEVSGAVRVTANDPALVKRAMDCGAQTIVFPNIETADEARAAVASMRFPEAGNAGTRGVAGMVRAGKYGLDANYVADANAQACTVVLIESVQALRNVSQIAAVDGVDCLFIGTADLSASMGYLGQLSHPAVRDAITQVVAAASEAGKAVGIFATNSDEAIAYQKQGIRFIALNSDTAWLASGSREALRTVRTAIKV